MTFARRPRVGRATQAIEWVELNPTPAESLAKKRLGRTVLYLAVGEPRAAADSLVTPEGHVLRYGESGDLIGVTVINAKWLADRDDGLHVSLPVETEELAAVFA